MVFGQILATHFNKNKTKCPLLPSSLLPAIFIRLVSVVTRAKAREAKVQALFLTKDPGLTKKQAKGK